MGPTTPVRSHEKIKVEFSREIKVSDSRKITLVVTLTIEHACPVESTVSIGGKRTSLANSLSARSCGHRSRLIEIRETEIALPLL